MWKPVLPAFVNDPNAWLKDVKPFLIKSGTQFRSKGPNELTSKEYAREFNEVKSLGSATSTERTADQTQAARYWAEMPPGTWSRIVRGLSAQQGVSLVDNAHNSLSAPFVRTLQQFFGTDEIGWTDTNNAGLTRSFTRLSQAIEEIINVRVWSGIHFRTADEQGARIGRQVANYRNAHYFKPVRDRGDDGDEG